MHTVQFSIRPDGWERLRWCVAKGKIMIMVNLSEMEEMLCPKCQRPFVAEPVDGKPNAYRFVGCNCDQTEFFLA